MIGRFIGATLRAILIMVLVVMPAVAVPPANPDERLVFIFLALVSGFLIFAEYAGRAPGLVSFRFAPPANRHRFTMVALAVLAAIVAYTGPNSEAWIPVALHDLGLGVADRLSQGTGPVKPLLSVLPTTVSPQGQQAFAAAAGAAALCTWASLMVLVLRYSLFPWPPRAAAFNLWANLPTLAATGRPDITHQLLVRARVNLVLAVIMPVLFPLMLRNALELSQITGGLSIASQIWIAVLWSILPANFLFRAAAAYRIATLVRSQHERRAEGARAASRDRVPAPSA